jgi:hypothetical protein
MRCPTASLRSSAFVPQLLTLFLDFVPCVLHVTIAECVRLEDPLYPVE